MTRKYLYALLICCSLIAVIVPQVISSTANTCTYNPEAYQGLEIAQLSEELSSTGLIGRIHGAADQSQMYVMSVREPDNFFNHREFSLISNGQKTTETINQLNRHDLVCVRGDLLNNPSPQQHIALNSIQVLEPWMQPEGFEPYARQVLPEELAAQTSLVGKVHAIDEEGKVLVVEYGDTVIPMFVSATKYTQGLYRGDIIKLAYQTQQHPQQPVHLQLDTSAEQPVEIIDAIADWNGQQRTLTGSLVKFPQSPQLKFDVYAMEVDTQGIKRYFTLINFENMAEFQNIRQKLAKIWDDNTATAVSGRNMLINPQVTIEATGIASIISPEQANPQILLDSAEQVQQLL
ncbi:hypothetical protein IQ255_27685 [Pleurocapsales cyanobacterium LEGE 10410]|nr:hypothetical protein [Pleurocapsales cyanobacterium LEGE 10410]